MVREHDAKGEFDREIRAVKAQLRAEQEMCEKPGALVCELLRLCDHAMFEHRLRVQRIASVPEATVI